MIPLFNKVHLKFKLNSVSYSHEYLKDVAYCFIKEGLPFEQLIGNFLLDWLDNKDFIEVKTSGSTGAPKTIKIKKQAMVHSAIATGNFFKVKPGDKALHCLPINFIAGKMMLVRAIILGLELDIIEPASQPIFDYKKNYAFCAMIPLQLQKTISYCHNIRTIIVGGAPVPYLLMHSIQQVDATIYETYGMTETLTHIAVKQLNRFESLPGSKVRQPVVSYFKTLPDITISQDKRACLVIGAPNLSDTEIITNDIVKLHSNTQFEWLGRYDNVINSGGIKVIPEQIETKLQDKIRQRFFISSEKDAVLGQKVILVIEGVSKKLKDSAFHDLEKYEIPKHIYAVKDFVETSSGKIQRQETLELITM